MPAAWLRVLLGLACLAGHGQAAQPAGPAPKLPSLLRLHDPQALHALALSHAGPPALAPLLSLKTFLSLGSLARAPIEAQAASGNAAFDGLASVVHDEGGALVLLGDFPPTDNEGNPLIVPKHLELLLPSAREKDPQDWTGEANFHLHSLFSDGSLSPEELVAALHKAGVREFALTDHDTVRGVVRAWQEAQRLGMSLHPGIELSAERGIHLGVLDVDIFNPRLGALLSRIRDIRLRKAQTFIERLKEIKKVSLTIAEVIAESYFEQGGTLEIVHLARVLVKRGLIKNVDEAYTTYLTPDVLSNAGDPGDPKSEEILDIVKAAGGVAFLNHPYTVRGDDPADILKKIRSVLAMGLGGVEVYRPVGDNPQRADQQAGQYLLWADEFKMLAGNGGDFHGMDTRLNNLVIHMPVILARQLLEALQEPQRKALAALRAGLR